MATSIAVVQTFEGKLIDIEQVPGVSSYPSGGFTTRLSVLRRIEAILAALPNSGYVPEVTPSATDNLIKVVVKYVGTTASPLTEIPDGTNISDVTFTIVALGYG